MRTRIDTDAVIAAFAGRQAGRVSRQQLLDAGIASGAIGRRVRGKRLFVEWPGVYCVGHEAETRHGRWWGAVLLGGEDAKLSGTSAAAARGLLPANGSLIHVTTPRAVEDRAHLRFHRADVATEWVDGLPVTTVGRTLVDLARTGNRRAVERALDEAAARGVLDVAELPERLPRLLRAALADHHIGSTITASEMEERLLALCHRRGLPRPECNARLTMPDGTALSVDALWRRERIAAELQSWRHHRTRFEADHRKRALLGLAGYRTPTITWRMLTREEDLVVRLLSAR